MAAGGGSPSRDSGGRDEWLRIYDRMVAILRKNHRHVEALLADRARLEALVKVQHQFWVARHGLLRGRLHEVMCRIPPFSTSSCFFLLCSAGRPAADAI
jgi:hypothetical protein